MNTSLTKVKVLNVNIYYFNSDKISFKYILWYSFFDHSIIYEKTYDVWYIPKVLYLNDHSY